MGVERMWYKMQDALHLRVKALDGVLLHLCCCVAGPIPVLCGGWAADTQLISCISRALYPLNTRNTPLVSGELDHVMEDSFMTCLPPTFPFPPPTLLLLPLLFTDSSS